MSDAKQFLLLDPNNLANLTNAIQSKNQRLEPLLNNELSSLDKQMLELINDPTLSNESKIERYNSTLAKFQRLRETSPQTLVKDNSQHSLVKDSKDDEVDPLLGISKIYKTKAGDLITVLKNSGLEVIGKRQVKINGVELPNSNITDLVNKAVNPNVKDQSPVGWELFRSHLKSSNIPKSLLSAPLKLELKESKNETIKRESPPKKKRSKTKAWSPY